MADDQQLSAQDIADLTQIHNLLPDSDPRKAKVRALMGSAPQSLSSMRPQDLAAQAMQQSGISGQQQLAPVAPRVNMQEQGGLGAAAGAYANSVRDNVNNTGRMYKAFGQDVSGAVQGVGGLAKNVIAEGGGSLEGMQMALGRNLVAPIVQSANDPKQSMAETLGTAMGVNSPAIKQAALNQDYPSIIGHSILPIGLAAMGGKVAGDAVDSVIPSKVRAGENFQAALSQAGDKPVNTAPAMEPAMRLKELNDAGSYLPPVVKKFIKRVTDPSQPPLTYAEARYFYSNAGDLSVTQRLKTNRKVGAQLNDFIDNLGSSIQDTADQAGVGQEHAAAMQEFAQSMRLKGVKEDVINKVLKPYAKALPYGAGAATGGALVYGTYKAVK